MWFFYLKLFLSIFLILFSFWLILKKIGRFLERILPARKTSIKTFLILFWIILELTGVHLLLDLVSPGQGTIHIYAPDKKPSRLYVLENLRIEIAPVKYDGHPDFQRIHFGVFAYGGIYSSIINFNWGEREIFVRIYDQTRPNLPLIESYYHISPFVRVGLNDKHIHLDDLN